MVLELHWIAWIVLVDGIVRVMDKLSQPDCVMLDTSVLLEQLVVHPIQHWMVAVGVKEDIIVQKDLLLQFLVWLAVIVPQVDLVLHRVFVMLVIIVDLVPTQPHPLIIHQK